MCVKYNKFKGNTVHCTRLADNIRKASGEGTSCDYCGNPIEACMCVCPYSARQTHASVACMMQQQAAVSR